MSNGFLYLKMELDEILTREYLKKRSINRESLVEEITIVFRDSLESALDELDIK